MAKNVSLLQSSWSDFTDLLTNRWQTYGWYVLLRFLVGGLFLIITVQIFLPSIRMVMANPEVMQNNLFWLGVLPKFAWIGLLLLVVILMGALFQFGFLRVLLTPKAEQSVGEIWARGRQQYWWTLGVSILAGILMGLIIVLGFVLLVVPGIFLLVMLCFSPLFVIMDGQGPIEALKSSWKLVKGRWWKVFGTLLFWIVISVILMWFINFLFSLGLLGMVNPLMMEQLSQQMNIAAVQGDMEQVSLLTAQMIGQVFQLKFFVSLSILVVVQTAVSIVPTYGVLSVYRVLRRKK